MLNETIKIESDNKKGFSINTIIKIREKLCKTIQFHEVAKQLSVNNLSLLIIIIQHGSTYNCLLMLIISIK